MINIQDTKSVLMVAPQTIGTTTVSGYVDTLGYNHLRILYQGATAAAADVLTALKIQEGDTTSAFTDVSGAVGGTSFTIPVPNTSTPDIIAFDVSMGRTTRKRYINISITGDATVRTTSVLGILGRPKVAPDTATLQGCAAVVYV